MSFILISCDEDTQNFCFRNVFYFHNVVAETATYKLHESRASQVIMRFIQS